MNKLFELCECRDVLAHVFKYFNDVEVCRYSRITKTLYIANKPFSRVVKLKSYYKKHVLNVLLDKTKLLSIDLNAFPLYEMMAYWKRQNDDVDNAPVCDYRSWTINRFKRDDVLNNMPLSLGLIAAICDENLSSTLPAKDLWFIVRVY